MSYQRHVMRILRYVTMCVIYDTCYASHVFRLRQNLRIQERRKNSTQ